MNINKTSATPQFKGYLKLNGGRYINSKQITSVIYDNTRIYGTRLTNSGSAEFAMTDGIIYKIQYLTKPVRSLIDNILHANKDDKTIVDIKALLLDINKSIDKERGDIDAQNMRILKL